ncbi:MAG: signal peptidase [Prosthecobacter sp.]|nr:signal peptidase [Prosthecobacter sp.]
MMNPTSSAVIKIASVAVAVLAALLVILRVTGQVGMFNIPTNAMASFVRKGDTIIVQAITLHRGLPDRGEVVTFTTEGIKSIEMHAPAPQIYIKRVVGLAGDKLQFKDGVLHINNKPVKEYFDVTHIHYVPFGLLSENKEYTVPADHFFMMGDNSGNSSDSRYWGPLPVKNLRHRYWFHLKHGPTMTEENEQP